MWRLSTVTWSCEVTEWHKLFREMNFVNELEDYYLYLADFFSEHFSGVQQCPSKLRIMAKQQFISVESVDSYRVYKHVCVDSHSQ